MGILIRSILMIVLLTGISLADSSDLLPSVIESCLDLPNIQQRAEIAKTVNPFYLRGDLDGDGKPDYAVAVKGKVSGRLRVLMCMGNSRAFLLGREDGGPPFSDMQDDNYFAPTWMIYSVPEAKKIGQYDTNEPKKLPAIRGEVLVMWWEDGMSAIYWDGSAFKWAGAQK